jgi:hypothetical protein
MTWMAIRNAIRTGWAMLGISLLLLLVLEVISGVVLRRLEAGGEKRQELYWADSDSYADADWIDRYTADYFRLRLRWEPYVYWRRRPFDSEFINVDADGRRATAPGLPAGEGQEPLRVFVFGGSTTWGEGARDDATVPSFLARELARLGVPADVLNYGEGGYVSTQELVVLLRELQRGNVPDVAVFYNGLNDRYSAAQSGEAGIPQNEWNRREEFNLSGRRIQVYLLALAGSRTGLYSVRLLSRLLRGGQHRAAPELPEGLAQEVVDAYLANVRAIQGLAADYGFKACFYWQPVLYDKADLTPFEQVLKETQPAHFEAFFDDVQQRLGQALHRLDTACFHDISGLFAPLAEPLYVDFSHLSEEGNRLVAERMAADLAPKP